MQLRDTLCHYAWVIQEHIHLLGLGVVFFTCITIVVSLCLPPVYQASSLVAVDEVTTNDIYSNQALAFSYAFLVTKDDVLQAAASQLSVLSVSQLKQVVSDSLISNTPIIEIRAQSANPRQAALIANVVAQSFIAVQEAKVDIELQSQDSRFVQNLQAAQAASDAAQARLIQLQANRASAGDIVHQRSLINTDQANYTALLDSYHQLQLLELQTPAMFSISQLATTPDQPVSPQVWLNAGIVAALSLLLLVTVILLLDWIDETIKTDEDVTQLTSLYALGSIPVYGTKHRYGSGKSVARMDEAEEAFVALSSALLREYKSKRSILVTGIRPTSGTSTVAMNLAMALARAGIRVLLIDANLRRPALHTKGLQIFHTQNLVGCLAELQMFHAARQQVVTWLHQWRTRTPLLWMLPAGPISSRSASLLVAPEMQKFVEGLLASQTIDMLIFDSASLSEGTDALTVAAVTDATLLVVEAGKERKETLHKTQATFERLNSPVLGVAINRWHKGLRPYFYTEHTQAENSRSMAQAQVSQVAQVGAQMMLLPDTPRPHILRQESLSGGSLAQIISPETPPSLAQFTLPAKKPAGRKGPSKTYPTQILQVALPTHKGIIMPVRPFAPAKDASEQNLRRYSNSQPSQ